MVEELTISLTYIKNNKGPRIEPFGTPQLIWDIGEFTSSIDTYCWRFKR